MRITFIFQYIKGIYTQISAYLPKIHTYIFCVIVIFMNSKKLMVLD